MKRTPQNRSRRLKAEIKRLREVFNDLPEKDGNVCEGLIVQAARLRIMLDDMWDDICANGDVERFAQSDKQDPYDRERPVARLFNSRDKNYASIIKQLCDLLPEGAQQSREADNLRKFAAVGR